MRAKRFGDEASEQTRERKRCCGIGGSKNGRSARRRKSVFLQVGVSRNGSAFVSRSERWDFDCLCVLIAKVHEAPRLMSAPSSSSASARESAKLVFASADKTDGWLAGESKGSPWHMFVALVVPRSHEEARNASLRQARFF